MNNRKNEIECLFYEVYKRKASVNEFTNWLYHEADEKEINHYFGEDFYFQLIDINYIGKDAFSQLCNLLESKISFGHHETQNLLSILDCLIDRRGDFVELLRVLYDMYCDGYSFLRFLGISYIANGLDDNKNNQQEIINKIEEHIITEAIRIKNFVKKGEIIIVDEYSYEDNRLLTDRVELTDINKMLQYD